MIDLTAIVFSKNRPIQLHALLESMFLNTNMPKENVHVLYKADHEYIWPMEELKLAFPEVNFHPEFDFRTQTMDLVNKAKSQVVFFTDDDVFKDKVDFRTVLQVLELNHQVFCFSLRLGKHLDFCYSTQQPQGVPQGHTKDSFFFWNWKGTDWDWNYPLSVDGHVFRREELKTCISKAGPWKSPNTFEGSLSHVHPQIPHPQMACFVSSKVFNIPHNRVQSEVSNVFGGGSENDLLKLWNEKKKIDISTFQGLKNKSAHQLVDLKIIDR